MKSVGLLCIAMLFLCGTVNAERNVWYVYPDSALNTIQAGLDSCADNDIVLVGPGTYYENIFWPNTQGIHLISELGPNETIIDGDSNGSVISCSHGVDTTTIIMGFTIQNGQAPSGGGIHLWGSSPSLTNLTISGNHSVSPRGGGGGISCSDNSSPSLENVTISGNTANHGPGGGICCSDNSSPSLENVTISGNTAPDGGGIYCSGNSNPSLKDVMISGNTAGSDGGGIYCRDNSSPSLKDVMISGNTAGYYGGGISCSHSSSPTVDSCTITNNTAGVTAGIYCRTGSNPIIHYCDIVDNDGYALFNVDPNFTINAENNWWGDSTGPYHPVANPTGLGDTVSGYVDFDPWLTAPVGVEEQPIVNPIEQQVSLSATIFRGPLQLPEGKKCKVFDITGRVVEPTKITRGIYFIEIDDRVVQKVVKIR